jgi:L-2-hydroxyglutarate oxidase LhgO
MIPRRPNLIDKANAFLSRLARARDHHQHHPFPASSSHSSSSSSSFSSEHTQQPVVGGGVDFETDVLVIGAGVVGLAVARAAALRLQARVVVVEENAQWGSETSSRSSEVVHAGLYYPPGSLKAEMCARGRDMLYDYCEARGVAHRQLGKLVVATAAAGATTRTAAGGGGENSEEEEAARLEALARNAEQACRQSGAKPLELQMLTGDEARELEPELSPRVCRALLSPRTGIVDSHGLMQALLSDAEQAGATLALRSKAVPMMPMSMSSSPPAVAGAGSGGGAGRLLLRVAVRDAGGGSGGGGGGGAGGETAIIGARAVVNCAGLGAEAVARGALAHLGSAVARSAPRLRYAKGHYFELAGGAKATAAANANAAAAAAANANAAANAANAPFSRLIYPLPSDGGLGIHLTLDLGGRVRFGPDVEWLPPPAAPGEQPTFDYRVPAERAAAARWHDAIRRYWPGLPPRRAGEEQEQQRGGGGGQATLVPAYSGVRPKLSAPGEPAEDFGLQTARGATWRGGRGHGVPGLVCLYGVESPGLTASLALAERVADEVGALVGAGGRLG